MMKIVDAMLVVFVLISAALGGSAFVRSKSRGSESQQPTIARLEARVTGTMLEPLSILSGDSSAPGNVFEPTGAPSLLIVLSSTCVACVRTLPVWRSLIDSLPTEIRTVALSREPQRQLIDWSAVNGLQVDALVGEAPFSVWGIQATPTTMLVNDSGRVLFARVGTFDFRVISKFVEIARNEVPITPLRGRSQ